MFIKGKDYITKISGINFAPSFRKGEENQGDLELYDEAGELCMDYQVSNDVGGQVISEISIEIMATPTSKNCVIDIEEVIRKVNEIKEYNMNKTLKQKLIYEKSLSLQDVQSKIEVLEQKLDDGILTEKEEAILKGLYKTEYKTKKDILKLYSID